MAIESELSTSSSNQFPGGLEADNFLLTDVQKAVAYVLFAVLILVALVGNAVMIWLILSNRSLRTHTNYFILNLALSDVLVTVLNTALLAIYNIHYNWIFRPSDITCKFIQFSGPVCLASSIGTHLAICYERRRVILTPLKPRLTERCIRRILIAIWVLAVLYSAPYIFVYTVVTDLNNGTKMCIPGENRLCGKNCVKIYTNLYQWSRFFLLYTIPLCIMTVMYWKICKKLWSNEEEVMLYSPREPQTGSGHSPTEGNSNKQPMLVAEQEQLSFKSTKSTTSQAQNDKIKVKIQAKRKLVRMLMTLVIVFAFTWVSFHVVFLISYFDGHFLGSQVLRVYLISFWLAMSNTMYNPMVYCCLNATFRNGFKYIFKWLPCVKFDTESLLKMDGTTHYRHPPATGSANHRSNLNNAKRGKNADVQETIVDKECRAAKFHHAQSSYEIKPCE